MTSESHSKPQSLSYPQIVILKQTLKGSLKLREGLATPYKATAGQIVCYEFRGIGMPPNDIGRPGDIFWDVTFPHILYFRGVHTWEAWNPRASEGSQLLAEHPCFRDRFLWMSGAGLSWLARQSLGKTKMDTNQFHTLGDQFQKELAAILHSAPSFDLLSLDIPNNRERHDAELARRRRNGVAVGTAPYITTVSSLLKRKRTWNEPESEETSRQVQGSSIRIEVLNSSLFCTANRNSTPSEEKPSSQVQLFAKTLSAEVASLQTDNSRLKNLLQDSERICEELSARCIEAQTKVDDLENSQRGLEERLTKAEIELKKRKRNAAKQDEELEGLRTFKTTVSKLVDGMDIPAIRDSLTAV